MDARKTYRVRSGLLAALAVAGSATGCGTPAGFRADPPPADQSALVKAPPPPAAPALGAALTPSGPALAGGTVVGAGGTGGQGPGSDVLPPMLPPPGPGAGDPLPQPRALPPGPGGPPPGPGGPPQPGNPNGGPGPVAADPHRRQTPTVTGGMLGLAPWEVPTDRVVDLGKQLEFAQAQNRELVARMKDLEGLGFGREQALAEAMREVEGLSAEAAKTRAALQASQAQVAALQDKLRAVEVQDIKLFQAVIEALGKLLAEGKR